MNVKGIIVYPFSILYGIITLFRNILFDIGILRERKHNVKVISVGNLTLGGTGKTPHVEYLIRLLREDYKIAVLSRGYGRKTKGFIQADTDSDSNSIGDEPSQYNHKFKDIIVAVDESRNRGVEKLLSQNDDIDVVILDDAFQHRWIKPDLSILLTDYHNMYHKDHVFPSGQLREFRCGANRADIVIVTKTSVVLSPIVRRQISDELNLKTYQKLLFSKTVYEHFVCWNDHSVLTEIPQVYTYILFSGIANSEPLQDFLKRYCTELVVISFPDHHNYTEKDLQMIVKAYNDQFTQKKILITTEKDAQRLDACQNKEILRDLPLYYVPIHVQFHHQDEEELNHSINNLFRY